MQTKKASIRGRRRNRKPVQLATSTVLTDRAISRFSDQELAAKFSQTPARVRQARYVCGYFRKQFLTPEQKQLIGKLASQGLSGLAISKAMGREKNTCGAVLREMKFQGFYGRHPGRSSNEEQDRVNAICTKIGLVAPY